MTSFSKGLGNLYTDPVKGMTQMTSSLIKGSFVETPVALAEGLRNMPRLYGDKPEKIQPIYGWKSGMTQAGKVSQHHEPCLRTSRPSSQTPFRKYSSFFLQGFYTGFTDGITGFVTKPYQEAKKDGAVGFMKGFAKGSVELFSKPGAGKAPTLSTSIVSTFQG